MLSSFLFSSFDMGDIFVAIDDFQSRFAVVSSICTKMFVSSFKRIFAFDLNGFENIVQLRNVMPVCCGDDD